MAKLTRAQVREVYNIISDLEAVRAYLMRDKTAICYRGTINAAVPHCGSEYRQAKPFETKDYTGRDDSKWSIDHVRTLQEVTKDSGSDLVRLPGAIRRAEQFIAANT